MSLLLPPYVPLLPQLSISISWDFLDSIVIIYHGIIIALCIGGIVGSVNILIYCTIKGIINMIVSLFSTPTNTTTITKPTIHITPPTPSTTTTHTIPVVDNTLIEIEEDGTDATTVTKY